MTRFSLIPASYVFLLREREGRTEVLLHLRRNTGYRDGHWACLAGHVEDGESALAAAAREAYEEAGVVIEPGDLEPLTTVHRTQIGGGPVEQRVDFFWIARRWQHEPVIREPGKNAQLGWFALADLPAPMPPQETQVLGMLAASGTAPPIVTAGFAEPWPTRWE